MATTPSVLILQHASPEAPGTLADVLRAREIGTRTVHTYLGEAVPRELGALRGLVIMGGPMGVYEVDKYPFLRDERRLLELALRAELPILGICLGSQLVASVLGAEVKPGAAKEIGWFDVKLTDEALEDPLFKANESSFPALHWHGDVFSLPAGAVPLASSERTPHQAFRHGRRTYAILFHLEVTESILRGMVQNFARELADEKLDGGALLREGALHWPALTERGGRVFDAWASLVAASSPEI